MFFIVINGWRINKWEYLYRDDDSARFMADVKSYSNADCLFIYDFKYKIQGSYEEIRNYNSVTFVNTKQLRRLPKLEIADHKELIVLICGDKQEMIDAVLRVYPQLTAYEELGKHNYSTTIRFYEMP